MKFVISLTDRIGTLEQIVALWDKFGDGRNPFSNMIFTPLFAHPPVLALIRDKLQHRGDVFFDSGGYYVQQGLVNYEALYQDLKKFYQENDWGRWYVLPDYVPTSSLSSTEVEERIQATITVSKLFFSEMHESLKDRALPVVQGHTFEQVQMCVESYASMGVTYVGFGSFGTSGTNNSINTITRQSIQMIEFLREITRKHSMKIHAFGIGTPEVLPLFYELGIDSFDSSGWSRTAGFGNVFLPFVGRRSITQRMILQVGGKAYKPAEFIELRDSTGHKCPFCQDVMFLKKNRIYQMLHNLCVVMDTVESLNGEGNTEVSSLKKSRYDHYATRRTYKPFHVEEDQ